MLQLGGVEFYITNVCNLACTNCNRLNNYKFSGFQAWKDYEQVYTEWSKTVNVAEIYILGGEPTLNPTFKQWCVGLRKLWPNATIQVISNGTRLEHTDFYNLSIDNKISWNLNAHDRGRNNVIRQYIADTLVEPIKKEYFGNLDNWVNVYNIIKDDSWPGCSSADDFVTLPQHIQDECTQVHQIDPNSYLANINGMRLQDSNNVEVELNYAEDFVTAPLKYAGNNKFKVYNSVPDEAHSVCISKYCHHFIKGKLYKCHHVALLPEFMKQYQVDISDSDTKLLEDYTPGEVSWSEEKLGEFLDNLKNPIDQCKLCPSNLKMTSTNGMQPKPSVEKLKTIRG
jgi:organic radical activating enzyme